MFAIKVIPEVVFKDTNYDITCPVQFLKSVLYFLI